jgi:hypothetical protein
MQMKICSLPTSDVLSGKPFSAWKSKPADLKESEKKSGWTGEQHLVEGDRIGIDALRKILANEQSQAILVLVDNEAKLKAEKDAVESASSRFHLCALRSRVVRL